MRLLDTYATNTGSKIDKPFIYSKFFPLPIGKYITFQAQTPYDSRNYSYWQEVINLIQPFLSKANIQIVQVGTKDEKPLNGISYYRLKQVDFDGKYTFTPLRSIKNSKELDFTLYPLPAKDQVIINYNHEKIDQIQLIDVLGNQIEVIQKNINGESILDVSDLKSGIYTVILTVGDKTINRKLIKA